jgi:hypothetical protein
MPFEPDYYHGSTAGSLIDIIENGLNPFGKIPMEKKPFTGELGPGIIPQYGVNRNVVSVVTPTFFDRALGYSTQVNEIHSWDPEKGRKHLNTFEKDLALIEAGKDPTTIYTIPEEVKKPFLEESILLEKSRLARWEKLSNLEKTLIMHPFPVAYGVRYKGTAVPLRSSVAGEHGIFAIPPEDLIIFVTEDKVDFVKELVKRSGKNINVQSLESVRGSSLVNNINARNYLEHVITLDKNVVKHTGKQLSEILAKETKPTTEPLIGRGTERGAVETRTMIGAATLAVVASVVLGLVFLFTGGLPEYVTTQTPEQRSAFKDALDREAEKIEQRILEKMDKEATQELVEKTLKPEQKTIDEDLPLPSNPLKNFGMTDEEYELLEKKIQDFRNSYEIGDYDSNFQSFDSELENEFKLPDREMYERGEIIIHAFQKIIQFVFEEELSMISNKNLNDQMETCKRLYKSVINSKHNSERYEEEGRKMREQLKSEIQARLHMWLNMYRVGMLGTEKEYEALGFPISRQYGGNMAGYLLAFERYQIITKEDTKTAHRIIAEIVNEWQKQEEAKKED